MNNIFFNRTKMLAFFVFAISVILIVSLGSCCPSVQKEYKITFNDGSSVICEYIAKGIPFTICVLPETGQEFHYDNFDIFSVEVVVHAQGDPNE